MHVRLTSGSGSSQSTKSLDLGFRDSGSQTLLSEGVNGGRLQQSGSLHERYEWDCSGHSGME